MSVETRAPVARPARGASDDRRVDVVHVIATLTAGGAERQLEMLTAHTRHPTQVFSCYESGGIAAAMREAGESVVELQADGWRKLLAPFRLARRLRQIRPEIVHVHLLTAQLLGIPAARLARVPMIVSTEHSLMEDTIEGRPKTWWLRLLYRALERMTTHTIAVSEVTADRLQRWGIPAARISVADLGIDFGRLAFDHHARQSVRDELGIAPETLVIGAVGRLEPAKRMHVVLQACAPLLHDGAELVVAGAGYLEGDLRALAARLGVADHVHWLGSRAHMGPVLSAMDVMMSASADESFGMAVVEAVGSGLPVAYVSCPALEDLVHPVAHADHLPATADDAGDAARLRQAVAERVQRSGQRRWPVPETLTTAYGAQAAADRVDAVYDRLLFRRDG